MKVPGDGPTPCKLFFMGEGPGIQEHRKGKPFVPWAPAGKEFKRFHEGIFLYREDIFVTKRLSYQVCILVDKEFHQVFASRPVVH